MQLSARLCGVPIANLDPELGERIFIGLSGDKDDMAALWKVLQSQQQRHEVFVPREFQSVASALASAFYTGTLGSGESASMIGWQSALMWQPIGATANGVCAGWATWAGAPGEVNMGSTHGMHEGTDHTTPGMGHA
jgi:fructose 5-dehydrogenase small subunit